MEPVSAQDIGLAAQGDHQAYARVVSQCQSVVTSIALSIVHDVSASKDVAQDVFLAAWTGLPKLAKEASFLPWLRRLTRNRSHDFKRRNWRHQKHLALTEVPEPLDAAPSAIERAMAAEQEGVLAEALKAIPPESREVLTLFYCEDGSVERCAALLGIKEDAVRKRLSRARNRLRGAAELRFADTVKKSAPEAASDAAVIALLINMPAAQAAGLSVLATKAKLPLYFGWALFKFVGSGLALGLLGLWFGVTGHLKKAIDERERKELRRFGLVQGLVMLAIHVGILSPWPIEDTALRIKILTMLLCVVLYSSTIFWLPRIIKRRFAFLHKQNPLKHPSPEIKQRRFVLFQVVLALITAAIGVFSYMAF